MNRREFLKSGAIAMFFGWLGLGGVVRVEEPEPETVWGYGGYLISNEQLENAGIDFPSFISEINKQLVELEWGMYEYSKQS